MTDAEEQRWCVVGGQDKGGILVRTGRETSSAQAESRLATSALVKEIEVEGDRLHYSKVRGEGPEEGWVCIKLKDKVLMEKAPVLEPKALAAGREADVYAEPPAPAPASRKIRILCAHGTAATSKVFKSQTAMLAKACKDDVELIFVDGCIDCDLSNPIVAKQVDIMKKYFPNEVFKQWADPVGEQLGWRKYTGIEKAVASVEEAIKANEPIDGVLGFSQGSNVLHCVAARAGLGKAPPLRCVVHICTSNPGWVAQMPDIFEYQIPVPALVMNAEKDTVAIGHDEIARTYAEVQRGSHSGEHRPLPSDKEEMPKFCGAIRDFIVAKCRE